MTITVPPQPELGPPNPRHPSRPARFSPAPTPTAVPLHARVLRRDRVVDPAYRQREQPVCEPTGERSRLRSGAAGADEVELVDLVRLHTPTPDVVIVRVSGTVDRRGAQLLAELARKQLNRAPHVVIDLANVSVLGPRGVAALLMLHQEAMALGTDLRIVGADHDVVHRPLRITGLAQLLSFDSTADAVIASLPAREVWGRLSISELIRTPQIQRVTNTIESQREVGLGRATWCSAGEGSAHRVADRRTPILKTMIVD